MNRGITLGVPGLALATLGGVLVEVHRAANAPVPRFGDHDASGRYGRGGRPVHVAVLGDSTCTGPGLDAAEHVWIAQLCDGLDHEVHLRSHARGGSRVADVLREQVPAATSARPDVFVLAVGANDVIHCTPSRQFAASYSRLVAGLTRVAPVVAVGIGDLSIIPRVPRTLRAPLSRRSAGMDRLHARICARHPQVVRVPVPELSDAEFARRRHELFAADLFHPNRTGHQLWAELFRPYVHDALERHAVTA